MRSLSLVVVGGLILGGFGLLGNEPGTAVPVAGQYDRYFATPQSAVMDITELMKSEDWATLTAYYDLGGTDIDRESLKSGDFFIAASQPEGSHPAGFWQYKQPFSPGFQFRSVKPIGNDEFEVSLMVEIDQGDGSAQRGLDHFFLKAYPEGYKVLPK